MEGPEVVEISSATDYVFLPFKGLFDFADKEKTIPPPFSLGSGLCMVNEDVTPIVLSREYSCPQHFYCPNSKPPGVDPLSVPSVCPPTLECQLQRLSAHFCTAQGLYEPVPCPRGYFCPDYSTKLICPTGYFCPTGTVDPRPCFSPFSYCPEGSAYQTYYGGILLCFFLDILLIIAYSVMRCRGNITERRRSRDVCRRESGRSIATISEARRSRKQAEFVTLSRESVGADDDSASLKITHFNILSPSVLWWRFKRGLDRTIFFWRPRSSQDSLIAEIVSPGDSVVVGMPPPSPGSSQVYQLDSNDIGIAGGIGGFRRDSVSGALHRRNLNKSKSMIKPFSLNLNEVLTGFKRAQNGEDLALNFAFDGLSLTLPSGKTILNGVNGSITPGRVTVIMGPSGAGKSTFMNVLMGKLDRTGGRLLINGREVETRLYKKLVGYVPQDDVMLMELTVRENILYSAKTRLPRSWSARQIENFVDSILEELDLTHVGDNLISAISGGQRKRVNIGMELVICPSAIFLDEPTSGLDSTAALKVASTIKKIATDIGISVVAVVHQPRFEIFEEFDDFLMIAPGGFTAYQGRRQNIVPYFENMGFYFTPKNNPADILMDIVGGKGHRIPADLRDRENIEQEIVAGNILFEDYEVQELVHNWKIHAATLGTEDDSDNELTRFNSVAITPLEAADPIENNGMSANFTTKLWLGLRKRSSKSSLDSKSIASETSEQSESHRRLEIACRRRGCGIVKQTLFAYNRSLTQQYRLVGGFFLELMVALTTGTLIGLAVSMYDGALYQGLVIRPFTLISPSPSELVVPMLSLIQACTIGLSAAPAGVKIFSEEREIYYREAAAGLSPLSYYIGKNIAATYRFIVSSLHFTSFFHLFAKTNTAFLKMFAIHICTFFTVYGMSFTAAMLVKRENASMIAVCISLVMAVLCGSGPSLTDMSKVYLKWILDMSYARWSAEAWYSEELLVFDNVFEIWDVSAATFGYTLNRFYFDLFMILCIGALFRVLGFILLIFTNRNKQR